MAAALLSRSASRAIDVASLSLSHIRSPPRAPPAAVSHQFETYYRDATYADCPTLFKRWQTCMVAKLKKTHEAEEMLRAESREGIWSSEGHIFSFQPTYAAEAQQRYGVEPEPTS